jgi:hypothetical protein
MKMKQHDFQCSVGGVLRRCTAARADKSWGPALKIEIRDERGALLNEVLFGCTPDQADYDQLRAKSTSELIDIVIERLSSGAYEQTLRETREFGIRLILNFSDISSLGR